MAVSEDGSVGATGPDMLKVLFRLQMQLNERIQSPKMPEPVPEDHVTTRGEATAIQADAILAERAYKWFGVLHVELAEAFACYPFKWWKKSQPLRIDRAKAKEELIDALHFLISLMLDLGMTAEEAFKIYMDKNQKNHARQDGGY